VKPPPSIERSLNLQPGDWVEVKSKEEILETLDEKGRFRGLYFMPGMAVHCGKRLRVYKRLERMILEATGELRDVKNTVLLEGAMCPGVGMRCDRSCFYFWREAWLKRAEPGTEAIPQLRPVTTDAATISIEEYRSPR
jgi:hypothetical protein